MKPLAEDDRQVAFWVRHARSAVGWVVLLGIAVTVYGVLSTHDAQQWRIAALGLVVTAVAPLIVLPPIDRIVRHRLGGCYLYGWEAFGVAIATTAVYLDGGVRSLMTLHYVFLLVHAALAYPTPGVVFAGGLILGGFLGVGTVTGASAAELLLGATLLGTITAVSLVAARNHRRAYDELASLSRKLEILAERDGLTGCLNHRAFHARLQVERRLPAALLLVDVDAFKHVNDRHGHPAGDAALLRVTNALRDAGRGADVVGRLGGDEFALLLPATDLAGGLEVAERVRELLQGSGDGPEVTVSIGVGVATDGFEPEQLFRSADRALYDAKRAGGDHACAGRGALDGVSQAVA